jgi:RNA polymerase sigma-70 factor (ECF subfamily)
MLKSALHMAMAPQQLSPATPISLLEHLRANNQDSWRRLLDLYGPLVRFWCGRCGLAPPDVEDIAQEVFAGVIKGLAAFRHDRPSDTFRGWLRVITRNQLLLFYRRNQGKPVAAGGSDTLRTLQQVADPWTSDSEDEKAEISLLWRRAMERVRGEFEQHTWLAFWLTVVEGRAPATLTVELDMTAVAIRQAKSRVLRRLKLEVGDIVE